MTIIDFDEKFIEESRQIAMRLSKSIISIDRFMKRHDEALGVLHQLILDLYKQNKLEIPDSFKEYRWKTEDPYGCPEEEMKV